MFSFILQLVRSAGTGTQAVLVRAMNILFKNWTKILLKWPMYDR
jgi:hypothetical protein